MLGQIWVNNSLKSLLNCRQWKSCGVGKRLYQSVCNVQLENRERIHSHWVQPGTTVTIRTSHTGVRNAAIKSYCSGEGVCSAKGEHQSIQNSIWFLCPVLLWLFSGSGSWLHRSILSASGAFICFISVHSSLTKTMLQIHHQLRCCENQDIKTFSTRINHSTEVRVCVFFDIQSCPSIASFADIMSLSHNSAARDFYCHS